MATNDIYNSKLRYDRFKENLNDFLIDPKSKTRTKRKYFCKNAQNMKYFDSLFKKFESTDISYIRRLKLLNTFKIALHVLDKDLSKCNRDDIDSIMVFMHTVNKSPKSKSDFIRDIKYIWKIILPDKDEKGRIDGTIVPYAVRHLSPKIDKSREKQRNDKLDFEEYKKILSYFSQDVRIQAFISLATESLARPQELLYVKIRDINLNDNYAKVQISEHGKEGTGILQCFDSFPYVLNWHNIHPLRQDPDAFFFISVSKCNHHKQLKPAGINKKLKKACKDLNIHKKISCYSLKRNGVTFDLLAGKKPQTIQHKARWSSLKQLPIYSKMNQEDNFNLEGIKKGKITDPKIIERYKEFLPGKSFTETKKCFFCGLIVGFEQEICPNCKRIVDRKKVKDKIEENEGLKGEIKLLKDEFKQMKEILMNIYRDNSKKSKFEGIIG
jgi:integrase